MKLDTREWQRAHGRKPRGRGRWELVAVRMGRTSPVVAARVVRTGLLSAAKAEARRKFPEVTEWKLIP